MICYLQPYASEAIVKLAKSPPTPDDPVALYISLTSSLPLVTYRGEIVGWENKQELVPSRLAELNRHIRKHQSIEKEIYMVGGNGKSPVNLVSVRNLERLKTPVPVSILIKQSNGLPLKPRSTSGGWSYVKEAPKWIGSLPESVIAEELDRGLARKVAASLKGSDESRAERLQAAPKYPEQVQTVSKGYKRNADVIAEVLLRANGHCEKCGSEAPFKRAKDGTPYLEVHHKIMLSKGGEDTVGNAIATCPNCHRELHFGDVSGA